MKLFKEEQRELLRIRSVLSPIGYYVCFAEKSLGHDDAVVHVVACAPGEHEAEIQTDAQLLESLPDDTTSVAYTRLRARRHTS
jgi:hypothetical protein